MAKLLRKFACFAPTNLRMWGQLIHWWPQQSQIQSKSRDDSRDFHGQSVFVGGENSIAVFSINQDTGEPTLIQNADTRGIHTRAFALDPSGRILVAANMMELPVRDAKAVRSSGESCCVPCA